MAGVPARRASLPAAQNPAQEIVSFWHDGLWFEAQYVYSAGADISTFDAVLSSLSFIAIVPGTGTVLPRYQLAYDACSQSQGRCGTWANCPPLGSGWCSPLTSIDGITVYSNAGNTSNGCSDDYGCKFQCVELAQRYSAILHGTPQRWGVSYAYQMYDAGPGLGYSRRPNDGTAPQPQRGDLIIWGSNYYGTGHVAIAAGAPSGGSIGYYQQNATSSGTGSRSFSGGRILDDYVVGWLHWGSDTPPTSTPTPTAGPNDGIELCDGTNHGQPCQTWTYSSDGRCFNLADKGMDNKAESLYFLGGYRGNYTAIMHGDNACVEVNERYDDYADSFGTAYNNQYSSMRIEYHWPPPTPTATPADTTPPTVNWIEPVGNEQVYTCYDGQTAYLQASASDNVAVQRVHFSRWDALNQRVVDIGDDYSVPYQASVSCNSLNYGWNQTNAEAFDTSGHGSGVKWIWLDRVAASTLTPTPTRTHTPVGATYTPTRTPTAGYATPTVTQTPSTGAARFWLSPAAGSYALGQEFDLAVVLDTGQYSINAYDVLLEFDASRLQFVSVQKTAATPWGQFWSSVSGGRLRFSSYFGYTEYHHVLDTVAHVRFAVIAGGTANVSFRFTPGNTGDTDVISAGPSGPIDVLGSVGNGVYSLSGPTPLPTSTPTRTPVGATPTTTKTPTRTPTATPTETYLPDLRPYALPGYPYPVVPSSIQGTHAVNTLYAGQTTYFDWYFVNSGGATATGSFHVELRLDGVWFVRYPYADWGPSAYSGFDDWGFAVSVPGWHTVSLVTDPDNTIAESDETNNTWQMDFYWVGSTQTPTATSTGTHIPTGATHTPTPTSTRTATSQWTNSPTRTATAIAGPATHTPTRTSTGAAGTATRTPVRTATGTGLLATATSTRVPGPYEQRVNAGGPPYTDGAGHTWASDQVYTPGSWGYVGGSSYSTSAPIAGTEDDLLYQTEHYSMTAYNFTVPNGNYEVLLKFAEIYANYVGARVFDVKIEGTAVLFGLDIYARVGKNAALDETFSTTVSDGLLTIEFESQGGTPKASAIQVVSFGSDLSTPTATPPSANMPWRGAYYANASLAGSPLLIRDDPQISFEWQDGAPAPGLPADYFSVRWTKRIPLSAGAYRFRIFHDDGARLWIDGTPVLDAWYHCRQEDSVLVVLGAGNHDIQFDMYEEYGWATARLWWTTSVYLPVIIRE